MGAAEKANLSDRRSVLANTRGYLVSHVLGHCYVFLTIPVLKDQLSPNEFGYYSLILSMITMVQIGGVTLFSNSLYKLYVEYKGRERSIFLGNIFVGMLTVQVVLGGMILAVRDPFVYWLYPNLSLPLDPFLMMAMFWLVLTSIKALCMTTLKIEERPGVMFRFVLCYGLSTILFIVVLVVGLGLGLEGALLAFILAEVSAQVVVGRKIWSHARIAWRPEQLRRAFSFSAPLVVGSVAFMMAMNLDRMVLSRSVSLDLIGDYGVGVMVGSVAALMVTSFTPSYTARVLKVLDREGRERAKAVLANAFTDGALIVGSLIVLLIIGCDVLGLILAGAESAVVVGRVATGIALGHFVRSLFLFAQNTLYVTGKSLAIMQINLILVVLVWVVSLLLSSAMGPMWVACSVGTAYLLLFGPVLLMANRQIKLEVPLRVIGLVVTSVLIVVMCQEWIYSRGFSALSIEYWGTKAAELLFVLACLGGAMRRRFRELRPQDS